MSFFPGTDAGTGIRSWYVARQEAQATDRGCGEFGPPEVIGGTDPELYARVQNGEDPSVMPVNHSPFYAPMLHPTLRTGVEAMLAAAYAWLD